MNCRAVQANVDRLSLRSLTEPPTTQPRGATARCVDGTNSFSQYASGTCSHHRGVSQWINHPSE
jgi:hypothetical protein